MTVMVVIALILLLGGWLFLPRLGFHFSFRLPAPMEFKADASSLKAASQFLMLRVELGKMGFRVRTLKKDEEGFVVNLVKGPKLYFNPLNSLLNQLNTLQSALMQDEKLRESFLRLKYIDLRIPGRIYYQ